MFSSDALPRFQIDHKEKLLQIQTQNIHTDFLNQYWKAQWNTTSKRDPCGNMYSERVLMLFFKAFHILSRYSFGVTPSSFFT